MGKFGALLSYLFLTNSFGVASFLFVLILFTVGMKLFFNIIVFPLWRSVKYSFFGIVWIPVTLSIAFPGIDWLYGIYGYQMNIVLTEFLGYSGMIMLLGFLALSSRILAFYVPFRWIRKREKPELLDETPSANDVTVRSIAARRT